MIKTCRGKYVYLVDFPLFRIFSVLRKNKEILLHIHRIRN